jgi:protein-disulfide isomerase
VAGQRGTVELVEFADYQCPYCRLVNDSVEALALRNGFRVVFRHFPIAALHPAAEGAARSAICAEPQGKFIEMHRYLMTREEWQTDTAWAAIASAVGVPDVQSFLTCRHSPGTDAQLREDRKFVQALRLTGTPAFVDSQHVFIGTTALRALMRERETSNSGTRQ